MRTVPANCRHCNRAFQRPFRQGGTQRFCSTKCMARHRYVRLNDRPEKPCLKCGSVIPANSHANRDYCSRACKKAVDYDVVKANHKIRYKTDQKYREMFTRNWHVRRARMLSVPVERFSPIAVLERDGWVCQICGVPTPKELRGLKVPTAPTLDHIIPLAKGGAHSTVNTQCACHRCNASKGAKLQAVA